MIPTGVWYYLDRETTTDVSRYNWVPFAGFVVFGFTYSVGIGCVAAILQGEMFPSNLKGPASALTAINAATSSAISTGLFVLLTTHVGVYMNFFVFAMAAIIALFFTKFYAIETKGKSLQMIQDELYGN